MKKPFHALKILVAAAVLTTALGGCGRRSMSDASVTVEPSQAPTAVEEQIPDPAATPTPDPTPAPTPTPTPASQNVDSDNDYYSAVTALDKETVEDVIAFNVRRYYLGGNWNELVNFIEFPVLVNGTSLANADEFLGYMIGKTVAESDLQAMNNEDFHDMFFNGQGICMGDGEIWLRDPNYMTDLEPALKVFAINGIVER